MSNPESFIEEVTEEVRRDRTMALMKRWGPIALAVVVLIVGGAGWNEWRKARAEAQAEAFGDALITALGGEDIAARRAAIAEVDPARDEQAAILALLSATALNNGEGGDPEAARARLLQLAETPGISPLYRDIANLKAIMLGGTGDAAQDALILESLATPGAPFRPLAVEQQAVRAIEAGDVATAVTLLRALTEDATATPDLRRRAAETIVALGASPDPGLTGLALGTPRRNGHDDMTLRTGILLATAALILVACTEPEVILPGERLAVRPGEVGSVVADAAPDVAAETVPLALAPPQRLAAWPMRVGNAANDPPHATLSAQPQRIWSANIGAGDTRRLRITADPVSDGTRIFTLDAQSGVTATSTAGVRVWSRALVPPTENAGDAAGGGLAVVDGTLYATTGFGELHALDAATGERRWVQELDAPLTTPKVSDGLVYVVSRDNRAWAIEADTGRLRWDIPAGPSPAAMATAPAPALTDRLVIFPFASGEVIAALRQSGIRVWGSSVAGQRRGVASGFVGDITGDPVVANGAVYAGTTSGRLVALERASGLRRWTADDGAVSPVVAAGDAIFAVTDRAQLVRFAAETGDVVWRTDLPFYRAQRLRRREGVFAHYGPVLAGGRLWVASSDGALRGFDPETGALITQVDVPGGAASRPIAFGDALYVTGRDGALHAYR